MIATTIVGILLFSFIYWQKLKDDYSAEKIFNSQLLILISLLFSFFLIKIFNISNYWFWLSFVFLLLVQIIITLRLKFKFYESMDALIISILPLFSLVYLIDSINNSSLISFLVFWFGLLCIFIYLVLNNYYKSFTWYKSGKVGFAGIATLGCLFLVRFIFVFIKSDINSFIPTFEAYFSAIVFSTSFLLIFFLSKQDA